MKIKIPYTPRKEQAVLHKSLPSYRYALLLCHRRFGKTTCALNHLIRAAYPAMVKTAESILKHQRAKDASKEFCMPIKDILTLIPSE